MIASPSRRALLAGLLASAGPGAGRAAAQSADDPVATVRDFYARATERNDARFMSRRLAGLFAAQRRRARAADSPLPGLDSDYLCGCQEEESGWKDTLRYEVAARGDRSARVLVSFRNFDERQAAFDLVRENGRWLVDDIRHGDGEPYSQLLRKRD